jgi:hypothetical protein
MRFAKNKYAIPKHRFKGQFQSSPLTSAEM